MSGGPKGESCKESVGIEEKCRSPNIPNCVDKNKYCSLPPMPPQNGTMDIIEQPLQNYLTIPGTKVVYECPSQNWAFDYEYDETLPSFYFTENINNMTITCNQQGFWKADFQIEDQTCVNKQDGGGCEYIFIPDCVDRNVYCSDLPLPANATKTIANSPSNSSENIYTTVVELECNDKNWYFNYSLPDPFVSFFYSTNIAKMTMVCNEYG